MSKISDKSGKFLLRYSNLFRGPVFIRTQCVLYFKPKPIILNYTYKYDIIYNRATLYRWTLAVEGGLCENAGHENEGPSWKP